MKKIVISGVNGFIGSSLCNKFLEMGYQVIGIGRSEAKHKNIIDSPNYTFLKTDQLDLELLKDADIFYHLAWNMCVYNSRDNDSTCKVEVENIKMSYETMQMAINAGIKKFVFCGSITRDKYYFDEDRNLTDIKGSIYGIAKQAASDICQKLAIDAGMEYNNALLANTYGPKDYSKKVVFGFIKKLVNDEDLDLIEEHDQADWVYIDDTVNALINVGLKGINMKTYYLGHRNIATFGENLYALKKALNSNSKLNFGVFKEIIGYDYSKVNRDELYEDTGFECQADFEDSFLRTTEWFEQEGLIERKKIRR